jgi:hypothetical protein
MYNLMLKNVLIVALLFVQVMKSQNMYFMMSFAMNSIHRLFQKCNTNKRKCFLNHVFSSTQGHSPMPNTHNVFSFPQHGTNYFYQTVRWCSFAHQSSRRVRHLFFRRNNSSIRNVDYRKDRYRRSSSSMSLWTDSFAFRSTSAPRNLYKKRCHRGNLKESWQFIFSTIRNEI